MYDTVDVHNLVRYRRSPGHAQPLQHIVNNFKQYIASNKVVVYKIDQVVGVGDVINDLPRFRGRVIELGPVCLPESKCLVLRRRERECNK